MVKKVSKSPLQDVRAPRGHLAEDFRTSFGPLLRIAKVRGAEGLQRTFIISGMSPLSRNPKSQICICIYIHPSSEVVGLFWNLENLGRAFFPHLETTTIAISRPQFSISLLVQKSLGQFLHPEPLGKRPGRKDLRTKMEM